MHDFSGKNVQHRNVTETEVDLKHIRISMKPSRL